MNQVSRWITSLTLLAVLLPHNSSVGERSSTVGFHGEGRGAEGRGGERREAFHLLYQAGYFSKQNIFPPTPPVHAILRRLLLTPPCPVFLI